MNDIQAVAAIPGGVKVSVEFGDLPESSAELRRFLLGHGFRPVAGVIEDGMPTFTILGPSPAEFLGAAQGDPRLTVPKRLRPAKGRRAS